MKITNKITKTEMVKHNISRGLMLLAIAVVPAVASAQSTFSSQSSTSNCTAQSLCSLVTTTISYFNQAIYLIIALAVVTFIWNVYKYFIISDPENRKEASKYVMFSVIGLFVILSFWGLVNIISNTLNLNTAPGTINVQSLTGSGSTSGTSGTFNTNTSSQNQYPNNSSGFPDSN